MEEIEKLREEPRDEERRSEEEAQGPLTLHQYLEACHSITTLAIEAATDCSSTAQGDTTNTTQGGKTNPTGRTYPRRIIPWTAFKKEQEKVWNKLSFSPSFSSRFTLSSRAELDFMRDMVLDSGEMGLQHGERIAVDDAVQRLVIATYKDSLLKSHLGLDGTVVFGSDMNLVITDDTLSELMEQASIGSSSESEAAEQADLGAPGRTARRRKARGKDDRTDHSYICRVSDGRHIPAVVSEYRAPHTLRRDEIVTGLVSEIQPDRDVIDQEGDGYTFAARRLTAAAVTQLFSYMVGKGIQYGYLCTGEAYIFLHIPDDPSCVYCSVCVPSLDVRDDDETRLHRTAVAQVFAFVLQAIQSPPPCQAWYDAAERLDVWPVDYEDVLRSIPQTDRKPPSETPYKPQRWQGFERSPILTRRSECLPPQDGTQQPNPAAGQGGAVTASTDSVGPSETQAHHGSTTSPEGSSARPSIQDRPYCTHQCLRGLVFGGPMDEACPNLTHHGNVHVDRREFLSLTRHQLAVDRGNDADCVPLYISGSRGSFFKFCLSSHGYTLVVKGVEAMDNEPLRHEANMYDHLRDIQGDFIPVCLGVVDLIKPHYHDCGVYVHFMLLSYGGRPILREMGRVHVDRGVGDEILTGLGRLHRQRVLHGDAELRNVLYDRRTGRCVIVDLMKSRSSEHGKNAFSAEMQSLRERLPLRLTASAGKRETFAHA